MPEKFTQSNGDGSERELGRDALGAAQVTAQNDARSLRDQKSNCWQACDDATIVRNLLAVKRDIEIAADKDAFPLRVQISDRLFLEHLVKILPALPEWQTRRSGYNEDVNSPRECVHKNVLETIGWTPLVQVNRLFDGLSAQGFAKLEFFNPGGSIKDRIALQMVLDAEEAGLIKPGDTLVEPTSGNTGIGLAMVGALRGYQVIIVMPEKMSMEKQITIEALGAQIVRTPTAAAHDDPESNFSVAHRIKNSLPNAYILDQFANQSNPKVHACTTASEIYTQMGGDIDYLVCSAGTGGSITGIARCLKSKIPSIKVIGVDPVGSILGGGQPGTPYQVEGIGYDFIPDVFESGLVDEWIKIEDGPSFATAGRLIREEGMLVGGSSGAVAWGALEIAQRCKANEKIVMILADGIRNYMTKFLSEEWMLEKGFEPLPKNVFVKPNSY